MFCTQGLKVRLTSRPSHEEEVLSKSNGHTQTGVQIMRLAVHAVVSVHISLPWPAHMQGSMHV